MATSDVLAPRSRHNRYVTTPDDVVPVGEWSREELFGAVKAADAADAVVVIDYGRVALYLADGGRLQYDPPRVLGIAAPAALHVTDPVRYDPATGETEPVEASDPPDASAGHPDANGTRIPSDAGSRVVGDGRGSEQVIVTPRFDLLVPAFDWEELSEDEMLPPVERDPSPTESGVGSGTPN